MSEFHHFIVGQILNKPFNLNYNNEFITINCNNIIYKESYFDYNSSFTDNDIAILLNITEKIENDLQIDKLLYNVPVIKYWFLITHEKYFISNIIMDKYDRIGAENLLKPFHKILKIPIADILKNEFNKYFNISILKSTNIYLTCDYDIMNIWDHWKFKNLIKILIKNLYLFRIKKNLYLMLSYLFSRKFISCNGYLNFNSFRFSQNNSINLHNIAFFITEFSNRKYDGYINYNDKSIKKFIQLIKCQNIHIGLHTNFDSIENNNISNQIENFIKIFNSELKFNRNHYLRTIIPNFLESLEKFEIECDITLYFPDNLLFRAGTSSKFFMWNNNNNKCYKTAIIPIALMDGTFTDYLKCSYEDAFKLAKNKIDFSLKYSNTIVLLWHNSSLNNFDNFRNEYHIKLYNKILDYLKI